MPNKNDNFESHIFKTIILVGIFFNLLTSKKFCLA
jgi:hypothetical protein